MLLNFFGKISGTFKALLRRKRQTNNFSLWPGQTMLSMSNSNVETNEMIFSVISRLANTLSSLPLKEYKNYEVQQEGLTELLNNSPNDNMSGFELLNQLEVARNETGNGYALIERDELLQPCAIWPIGSSYVLPKINTDDNSLWYFITGLHGNLVVPNTDIIHVKHITGPVRILGISPLDVLRNALDFDGAVQKFSMNEMSKTDSFILEYGANVDEEKRQEVIDDFRRFKQENGGVFFNEPGVEVKPIQRDFVPSDIASTDQTTRIRIANAFDIPVSFLNDLSSGSYSSNEQIMTQFVQMTLLPIVKQYESEFNRKLLTKAERSSGYYFKFNVNGLLRGDTQARTALYSTGLRSGVFTPNDVRRLEDMPPANDEYADKLWISGDLYTIDTDPEQRKGVNNNGNEKAQTKILANEAGRK